MLINAAQTQIAAHHAHRASGGAHQQREKVLAFIAARGGDWSIGEVAHTLGMDKSTVSARINELLNDTHELVAAAKRKDRVSGVMVRPVALPPGQQSLFQ